MCSTVLSNFHRYLENIHIDYLGGYLVLLSTTFVYLVPSQVINEGVRIERKTQVFSIEQVRSNKDASEGRD